MQALPAVSVVVPTHNRPERLRTTIQAILGQDYTGHIHSLVVHDGEAPYDLQVAPPPGRTIEQIVNTGRRGLAGARNAGNAHAQGELVAFCDDDDVWYPTKLSKQVPLFDDSSCLVVGSGANISYGRRTWTREAPERITSEDLLRERVAGVGSSSLVVRREALFGRIGLIDEEIPGSYGEDYDWLLRAARFGPVFNVKEPLLLIAWHRQSHFAEKWLDIASANEYLLNKHPGFRDRRKQHAYLLGKISFAYAAAGHRRTACEYILRALSRNPSELRVYLALAVAAGFPASLLLHLTRQFGRGI